MKVAGTKNIEQQLQKWLAAFAKWPWWLQWLTFSLLAILLYFPIIGNSFVNDDFISLKKIGIDKKLNFEGFFRPLSDGTLYLNFILCGFRAWGYYLWNILFHALDGLLLFHFCLLWKWTNDEKRQLITAALSAVLFLSYPFHSEAVVWILGRAALTGSTFGILAFVILAGKWNEHTKLAGVAICYFFAMAGYESVIVLPGMVFIWLLSLRLPVKKYLLWMGWLAFTLTVHLVIRRMVSGTVAGDYGAGFFQYNVMAVLAKAGKVLIRLFLPPIQQNRLLLGAIVVMIIAGGIFVKSVYSKIKVSRQSTFFFFQVIAILLMALLVPFLLGVSTHTSESDRFLHFPSFFLCILISFCLVNLCYGTKLFPVVVMGILVYNIWFLESTIKNWRKSSDVVSGILDIIKKQQGKGMCYVVNMPGEIDGAFVFRSGFAEALLVNKLNTESVVLVNIVKRDSLILMPPVITPKQTHGDIFIPPATLIRSAHLHQLFLKKDLITIDLSVDDKVVYWNRKNWVLL